MVIHAQRQLRRLREIVLRSRPGTRDECRVDGQLVTAWRGWSEELRQVVEVLQVDAVSIDEAERIARIYCGHAWLEWCRTIGPTGPAQYCRCAAACAPLLRRPLWGRRHDPRRLAAGIGDAPTRTLIGDLEIVAAE